MLVLLFAMVVGAQYNISNTILGLFLSFRKTITDFWKALFLKEYIFW